MNRNNLRKRKSSYGRAFALKKQEHFKKLTESSMGKDLYTDPIHTEGELFFISFAVFAHNSRMKFHDISDKSILRVLP